MKNIAYVGIDVDDTAYHVAAVDSSGSVLKQFNTRPCIKKLSQALKKHLTDYQLQVCYEATYIGYTLQRKLSALKIDCCVVAPTSIPRSANERVKNDRIDALKLATLLSNDILTRVAIPTEKQEADRSLVRSREKLVKMRSDHKRHILSLCRDMGIDYLQETQSRAYWTQAHRNWLDKKITSLSDDFYLLKINLSTLLSLLESITNSINDMELHIQELAKTQSYRSNVQALVCFKGIQVTTAMVLMCEIFDVQRFDHPKKLAAYLGLDVREHSSGGKQKQFGISKMGNKRARKALVESCQMFGRSSSPSKRLEARRNGVPKEIINIAERAQERLYKKGHRLLAVGKPRNVVKVACARELVGFIWESLKAA